MHGDDEGTFTLCLRITVFSVFDAAERCQNAMLLQRPLLARKRAGKDIPCIAHPLRNAASTDAENGK